MCQHYILVSQKQSQNHKFRFHDQTCKKKTNDFLFYSTLASISKKRVGTPAIYETFQGLSTGVLLLKLKSMRVSGASKKSIIQRRCLQKINKMPTIRYQGEYNAELSSTRMEALAGKYLPKNDWVLAEQDW